MLSDSGALVIAMVSLWISKRKSSKNTFGSARAQELGAMVNCILLMSLCFSILVQAIKRLVQPEPVERTRLTFYIVVGIIGLAINVLGLLILGGDMAHGHSHGGDNKKNEALIEDGDHLCNDEGVHQALNNTAVTSPISQPLDDLKRGHSHVNAAKISSVTIPLNSVIVDDKSEKKKKKQGMSGGQLNIRGAFLHVLNDAIGSVIVIISGLCMKKWPDTSWVWQLSGSKIIASAHIRCHNLHEYMTIAEQVKDFFHNEGIHSTTIQPEFINEEVAPSIGNNDCILECLKDYSINTCCGQPSAYVKFRNNRDSGNDKVDENNIVMPI
ncbi:unnamed protein product [Didymodactylos carnosus]|uniref:Cation efflux protein transmembrane domain-containing protein n=1 Tax=Didymodactylos carnosus TaxID=1234261 RepID=A0A813PMG0_9BILA|nr:unnamed protein product [Didymodactylos carnosus]CAF3535228.1 unnamed protein product [Didymodactylos carnosus]